MANTRKGKSVLGLDGDATAALLVPAGEGDHVAVCTADKLLLIFPITELSELARGKGVRLQRCRQTVLSGAHVFRLAEGLPWRDSAGQSRLANQASWRSGWVTARTRAADDPQLPEVRAVRGIGSEISPAEQGSLVPSTSRDGSGAGPLCGQGDRICRASLARSGAGPLSIGRGTG